jgi:hypothetical protein
MKKELLLRFGDGEYMLANYRNIQHEPLEAKCKKDWGRMLTEKELDMLSKNIITSFKDADIVGLSKRSTPWWKETWEFFSPMLSDSQKLVSIDWGVDKRNSMGDILNGKKVFYVGGLDIEKYIKKNFKIRRFGKILLIPEHKFSKPKNTNNSTVDLVPKVRKKIQSLNLSGYTCILSGGVAGKIFGVDMYNAGGDVYDIGAVADFWCSVGSRTWIRDVLDEK